MLELIINKEPDKKNIMLVENGILVEKHEEHEDRQRLEGNIYCGKVQNVLSGMQSAFIDIGDKRNTFIRLKDLLPKEDVEYLNKITVENQKMIYVPQIAEFLDNYQNNRDKYKTLEDFIPELLQMHFVL